jgi:hypothetical protein
MGCPGRVPLGANIPHGVLPNTTAILSNPAANNKPLPRRGSSQSKTVYPMTCWRFFNGLPRSKGFSPGRVWRCADHSSMESHYALGPVVTRLRQEAGLASSPENGAAVHIALTMDVSKTCPKHTKRPELLLARRFFPVALPRMSPQYTLLA